MRRDFLNLFLLGTIAMGSMMFGMTSCSDDEKKVQSASEVEKRLKELSNEVAKQSEVVVNKTNEFNQLVLDIENGTTTKSSSKSAQTKAQPTDDGKQNLRNKLDQLKGEKYELESDIKQLNDYISGITITISGEVLNSAKDTKAKGVEVYNNAILPIKDGETYLAQQTQEHWNTLVKTARTSMIFKVAFDSRGGSKVDTAYVKGEGKVTKPTDPTLNGYSFIAWYSVKTDTLNKQFDFNSVITKDITLYAFWKENGGGGGDTPKPAVTSITLSKTDTTFKVINENADPFTLVATVLPAEAEQTLNWSSNNTQVASVENGRISIKQDGEGGIAVITASAKDNSGKSATFNIVVRHKKKVDCKAGSNRENIPTYAVQLWAGGPWWAEFNVGATIESYSGLSLPSIANRTAVNVNNETHQQLFSYVGNYFNWGATDQHTNDTKSIYKDVNTPLSGADDVATAKWGANWCMPDTNDVKGLAKQVYRESSYVANPDCKVESYWCNGSTKKFRESIIPGICFKGKDDYAGDSIFFPAADFCGNGSFFNVGTSGNYWSSVPRSDGAWVLIFSSGDANMFSSSRNAGQSVRAVCAE